MSNFNWKIFWCLLPSILLYSAFAIFSTFLRAACKCAENDYGTLLIVLIGLLVILIQWFILNILDKKKTKYLFVYAIVLFILGVLVSYFLIDITLEILNRLYYSNTLL